MKKINIFLVFIVGFSLKVNALTCHNIFNEIEIQNTSLKKTLLLKKFEILNEYHQKYTNHALLDNEVPVHLPNIIKLAEQVITDNFDKIKTNYYKIDYGNTNAKPINIQYSHFYADQFEFTNYLTFVFMVNGKPIEIRSNGYVAFLDKSWMYRQNKVQHYQMAYLFNKKIISGQQTEFLLSTFLNEFNLSRDMGRKERNRWLNGEEFYQGGAFGSKVHFAPNYFRFKNYQPYMIHLTKDQLIDFYLKDGFEINTYDFINDNNRLVRTPMRLEIEVVFIGDVGISLITPIMQQQLVQDVLGF